MKIGSLFAGIGGLELGLERAGLGQTVWQVEIDYWCRGVLKKHWPDVDRSVVDVRYASPDRLGAVDVLCGGFPCQDISVAGKGAGLKGERSGLAYQFLRCIEEFQPKIVIIENVHAGWRRYVPQLRRHLHGLGYASVPLRLRASEVGAPHRRARVFLIAYPLSVQLRQQPRRGRWAGGPREAEPHGAGKAGEAPNPNSERRGAVWRQNKEQSSTCGDLTNRCGMSRHHQHKADRGWPWCGWTPSSPVRGVDDGVPSSLDRPRLKALGNAVVPQCAEVVGRWICQNILEEA